MNDTTNQMQIDEQSLGAVVAKRARATSDTRLALDAAGGLCALVVVLLVQPPAWHILASLALLLLAFGIWGIVDRELSSRRQGVMRILLLGARVGATIVGAVALLVILVSLLMIVLSPMKVLGKAT